MDLPEYGGFFPGRDYVVLRNLLGLLTILLTILLVLLEILLLGVGKN